MSSIIDATRRGEMPVAVVTDSLSLVLVSLAPVERAGRWIGAAGVASPLDEAAAGALAGLTRSDLVLLLGSEGSPPVSSSDSSRAPAIAYAILRDPAADGPREIRVDGVRYLVATAPLAGATVAFVRDLRRELAILPRLRNVLAASAAAALVVALLLGTLLALFLTRPVRALATAADRVAGGDFGAPLAASPVREVQRVTQAFDAMRNTLSLRIEQLRAANRMLEERQARLAAMQSELIRRERMAVSGRMAVELAHEIRNPVANLRNCLELLYRRLDADPQGREFATLAIDELLRMHELAERMLDLNRPRDSSVGQCDVAEVAREVAALTRLGGEPSVHVNVRAHRPAHATIPPDAMKQVLLNLVQNAREAMPRGLVIEIDVSSSDGITSITVADNGPGVPPEIRASIFDPFFTARAPAGGTGLGLFMVEGVVAAHGGTVQLVDETNRQGARFRITLPAAQPPVAAAHAVGNTQALP
jgi:signal transduction histidine kinase